MTARSHHPVEWAALGFALVLLVASSVLGWLAAAAIGDAASPAELAARVAAATKRERLFLFPLGVATSMSTLVALLIRGEMRSARARFQLLAVVVLFFSGYLGNGPIADAAKAVVLAAGAAEAVETPLASWVLWRWVSYAIVVATTVVLTVAHLRPLPPAAVETAGSLTSRHRLLLFLLGAATFFEGYDRFIASLALPYIGKDLGASESVLGYALSAIRIGALLSIPLGRLADRRGRRGLLLFTILAYTATTAATGLSRGIESFVVFQLLAMIFLLTELSLAQVVIAEEFPRDFRAQGQAFLGAFGALGAGFAAVIFPMLQETALGWRGLYFVGLAPLLLIAWLRRALPETERWREAQASGRTDRARFADLARGPSRVRFFALLLLSASISAAAAPAFAFASYRATRSFGWGPEDVSGMILVGGSLGLGGWFLFGSLAERVGRRAVVVLSFLGATAAILCFYRTSSLWLAFAAMVFTEAGAALGISALGTEVFATEMRSTAKVWITSAGIVGSVIGLGVVGGAAQALGGVDAVVAALAILPSLAVPLVRLLPEPRGRELEEMVAPA